MAVLPLLELTPGMFVSSHRPHDVPEFDTGARIHTIWVYLSNQNPRTSIFLKLEKCLLKVVSFLYLEFDQF